MELVSAAGCEFIERKVNATVNTKAQNSAGRINGGERVLVFYRQGSRGEAERG